MVEGEADDLELDSGKAVQCAERLGIVLPPSTGRRLYQDPGVTVESPPDLARDEPFGPPKSPSPPPADHFPAASTLSHSLSPFLLEAILGKRTDPYPTHDRYPR
jgi:hypothetical protein